MSASTPEEREALTSAASGVIAQALLGLVGLEAALGQFLQREGLKVQHGVTSLCEAVAGASCGLRATGCVFLLRPPVHYFLGV
jgi:hypothetical protein